MWCPTRLLQTGTFCALYYFFHSHKNLLPCIRMVATGKGCLLWDCWRELVPQSITQEWLSSMATQPLCAPHTQTTVPRTTPTAFSLSLETLTQINLRMSQRLKYPLCDPQMRMISLELSITKTAHCHGRSISLCTETTSFFILSLACRGEAQVFEKGPGPVISQASCEGSGTKLPSFSPVFVM